MEKMECEKKKWKKLLSKKTLSLNEGEEPESSDFYKDIESIIFSYAFRRMQNKTQVLPVPELDFVHTRLTHSLEVFCIGRKLGKEVGEKVLKIKSDLKNEYTSDDFANIVGAACLAHDIGNPPFGHSGEDAFREFFLYNDIGKSVIRCCKERQRNDFLKFEGNAQGFRILNKKNKILPELTCATLASFMKYPRESVEIDYIDSRDFKRKDQKKFGFFQTEKNLFKKLVEEVGLLIKPNQKDKLAYCRHPLAYLVEAADDIAYIMFDIDDGFRLKLFNLNKSIEVTEGTHKKSLMPLKESLEKIIKAGKADGIAIDEEKLKLNDEKDVLTYLRSKSIESLIGQIKGVFMGNYHDIMKGEFKEDLISCIDSKEEVDNLKQIAEEKIYKYYPVLEIEAAGFKTIGGLLEAFLKAVIKKDSRSKYSEKVKEMVPPEFDIDDRSPFEFVVFFTLHVIVYYICSPCHRNRVYKKAMNIVDYICGMSDTFAVSLYRKIHGISLPHLY